VVDRAEPGDLLSRVTGDTTQLRAATTTNVVDLVAGVIQIVGAAILMAPLDAVLFAVVLLVLLTLAAVTLALVPRIRSTGEQAQETVGELTVSSLVAFLLYLFYLGGPATQVVASVTGPACMPTPCRA
jgi:ABC-type multidrug transport system fused ATPase/permease subunit